MAIFTGLLRTFKREFRLENRTDHGNGFIQEVYTDGLDTYQVEIWEGQPRTIIAPDRTQYYAYGEYQRFKK